MAADQSPQVIVDPVADKANLLLFDALPYSDGTTVSLDHATCPDGAVVAVERQEKNYTDVHVHLDGNDLRPYLTDDAVSDDGYESATSDSLEIEQKAQPKNRSSPTAGLASAPPSIRRSTRIARPLSHPRFDHDPILSSLSHLSCSTTNLQDNHSNHLKTLLLPDMVRAKGVKLVSPTEITSMHRFRSYSDPMRLSLNSKHHKRTLSMPSYMSFGLDHILEHPIILEENEGGGPVDIHSRLCVRDLDLDTSDEPVSFSFIYLQDESIDNAILQLQETKGEERRNQEDNEDEHEQSPLAGNNHSFRYHQFRDNTDNYNDVYGTFDKPLVIIYERDPFFSSFTTTISHQCHDFDEEKENTKDDIDDITDEVKKDQIVIESWIVEGDDRLLPDNYYYSSVVHELLHESEGNQEIIIYEDDVEDGDEDDWETIYSEEDEEYDGYDDDEEDEECDGYDEDDEDNENEEDNEADGYGIWEYLHNMIVFKVVKHPYHHNSSHAVHLKGVPRFEEVDGNTVE